MTKMPGSDISDACHRLMNQFVKGPMRSFRAFCEELLRSLWATTTSAVTEKMSSETHSST
jgi:hypothetical protein